MDSTVQQIVAFRKFKWKMPWINAYIGSRIDTGVTATFQVITIPKRYLIDPHGILIALGEELTAAKLEETLKKYIEK